MLKSKESFVRLCANFYLRSNWRSGVLFALSMYLGHLEGKILYKMITGEDWPGWIWELRRKKREEAMLEELEEKNFAAAKMKAENRLIGKHLDRVEFSSNWNSVYGSRTFCATKFDLSTKKSVPCNSKDMRPMTEQSANELIPKVAGWDLVNEDGILKLNRSWKVKSVTEGLELFKLVADVAEAEGHHPDLHFVGVNNVKIEIWTHAVGGLTERDFILAAKVNVLDLHHLLRTKSSV